MSRCREKPAPEARESEHRGSRRWTRSSRNAWLALSVVASFASAAAGTGPFPGSPSGTPREFADPPTGASRPSTGASRASATTQSDPGSLPASVGPGPVDPIPGAPAAADPAPGRANSLRSQPALIRFRNLNQDDGLFQGTVTCVLQDRVGYIWFGTQEGRHRWNGYELDVFRHLPGDSASLASNTILSLAEDPDTGNLWIGTQGGGLSRWVRAEGRFENLPVSPTTGAGTAEDRIQVILPEGSEGVWLGTSRSGLDRLDPSTGEVSHFGGDATSVYGQVDPRIRSLLRDRQGDLWVGTLGGLYRISSTADRVHAYRHAPDGEPGLANEQVRALHEDSEGRLWIGTEGGLHVLEPGDRSGVDPRPRPVPVEHPHLGPAVNQVRSLLEDSAGRLWVGTDGGLLLYRENLPGFWAYRHDPADPTSLANDRVLALAQDRSGLLWVGTGGGGLDRWQPAAWQFHHYRRGPEGMGLSHENVVALSTSRDGRVWVGTLGGGLDVLDRGSGEVRNYSRDPSDPTSLPDDRVMALAHGHGGRLWVGTMTGGLARLDPGNPSFTIYRHRADDPSSLAADAVMSLLEDSRGRLWVGTFGAGLDRLDPGPELEAGGGRFRHYPPDPELPGGLPHGQVTDVLEGAGGELWVATWGGGLALLPSESEDFRRFRSDPDRPGALPSDAVLALHLDARGRLWVGTQGGGVGRLLEASPGMGDARFSLYSERDGLPSSTIWGIESDNLGRLWISTNRGLARLDPDTGMVVVFTAEHGLQSNELNFGAHHRSHDGELFFGGIRGFNAFFPGELRRNEVPPPVVFTAFTKLNRPVDTPLPLSRIESVELDHRDYAFSFEFAALDFNAPESNRYAYMLEGLDEDWIDYGSLRRVTFTNLDPGQYVLKVRGTNNDGVWSPEGAQVAITVLAPPWRSRWAYLAYALMAVSGAVAFVRIQRAKDRQREDLRRAKEAAEAASRAKSHFLANMSHEIRTPMNGVIGTTSLLLEMPASDRQRRYLESLRVSSESLVAIINDILDFSKIEAGKLAIEETDFRLDEVMSNLAGIITQKAADK
ncbi:MAG: hypothetical protein MI919_06185, partial [Holophagales bacterium]|nr:hypothetical protein [Holophagales bacterium]